MIGEEPSHGTPGQSTGERPPSSEPATRIAHAQTATQSGPAGPPRSSILHRHPLGVAVASGLVGLIVGAFGAAILIGLWLPTPPPPGFGFPPAAGCLGSSATTAVRLASAATTGSLGLPATTTGSLGLPAPAGPAAAAWHPRCRCASTPASTRPGKSPRASWTRTRPTAGWPPTAAATPRRGSGSGRCSRGRSTYRSPTPTPRCRWSSSD